AMARGPLCRPARGLLQAAAADPRSRTLCGCVVSQTRRIGRIQAAGTETASRSVATQLRSDLASAHGKTWQAEWHETDDRSAQAFADVRPFEVATRHRVRFGHGMLRRGRRPASPESRGTAAYLL